MYIDEIKEGCLKEGVLEKYQREKEATRRYLAKRPRWKAEWYEWVLPAVIVVMWAVTCAVVNWEKPLVLIFTEIAAGVVIGIVYLVAWRGVAWR